MKRDIQSTSDHACDSEYIAPALDRQDFIDFGNITPAICELVVDQHGQPQVRATPLNPAFRFHTHHRFCPQIARSDEDSEWLEPVELSRHIHSAMILPKQKLRVG